MLLYTRVAASKPPRRRSRAGCSFCKDKKKKCDEARPSCARCQEHGQDCRYEPVKTRQRRKLDTAQTHPSSTRDETRDVLDSCLDLSPSCTDAATSRHSPSKAAIVGSYRECDAPELSSTNVDDCQCSGDISAHETDNTDGLFRIQVDCPSESSTTSSLALVGNQIAAPPPILEFLSPSFGEFSPDGDERLLIHYFCDTLSHLIVLREDQGNPFQQLVLPLASRSRAVKSAIYALASAHLVGKGRNRLGNEEKSIRFHNEAVGNLAKLIAKGHGVDRNELLATIMLIVYYEVLVQRRRSNLVQGHLKGAMAIMRNSPSRKDRTSIFLEEAFLFYDVIAALSSGTAPLSDDNMYRKLEVPSFRCQEQQVSVADGADALLGLATSLWPVIHRLSGLLALKNQLEDAVARGGFCGIAAMQAKFVVYCAAVEASLVAWQPVMPTDCAMYGGPETMSSSAKRKMKELQSILNNALAYRHSALVYLHRTIYESPRHHSVVQHHASASLVHCKATVQHEGPMGALLWPLFVASCEAVDPLDRQSARDTFQGITHRQGMENIDRAWEVVQEVWKRADEADRSDAHSPRDGIGMGGKDPDMSSIYYRCADICHGQNGHRTKMDRELPDFIVRWRTLPELGCLAHRTSTFVEGTGLTYCGLVHVGGKDEKNCLLLQHDFGAM